MKHKSMIELQFRSYIQFLEQYRFDLTPAFRCFVENKNEFRDANSILREVMKVSERPTDVVYRINAFYTCMDENDYEEADRILTEIEEIVGTNDPDIAAARTALDLEKVLGE